jgi:hypothetical protein
LEPDAVTTWVVVVVVDEPPNVKVVEYVNHEKPPPPPNLTNAETGKSEESRTKVIIISIRHIIE